MKIGFIGLGIMGAPMARNLAAAGHELVVTSSQAERREEFAGLGAEVVGSPREVAERAGLVLTMLPDSPQVRQVALGADGVRDGAHEGLVLVDCSSIDPGVAREVAAELGEAGVGFVDAPVSGGEPMAVAGTLSFMVGGPQELVQRVRPVLEILGRSVVRVGDVGAGNVTKLANQAIVAVNIAVLAEALVLAQKAGVAPGAVLEAISGGLAGSNVLNAKGPMMLAHDFAPGFRIELHLKDLANVAAAAHAADVPMPVTALVHETMLRLRAHGHGGEDHSALLRAAEDAADVTLRGPQAGE